MNRQRLALALCLIASLAAVIGISGCGSSDSGNAPEAASATTPKTGATVKPPVKALTHRDTVVGKGLTVEPGDTAEVLYMGSLNDGSVFDENMKKTDAQPFAFVVGAGSVIKGWDQGVVGMKVGGTRELDIPYALGYGDKGSPPKIPAQADLFFTIKLLGVVKKGEEMVYDPPVDTKVGTGPAVKDGDYVTITYAADFLNGTSYLGSEDGKPLEFQTITGDMKGGDKLGVVGLRYALKGMKVGGVREIILPPAIAYTSHPGPGGGSHILKYTITLVKLRPGKLPAKGAKS